MFKQSRRKIVAAIMSILVLLWVGTLGIIYASSYLKMVDENMQMLKAHADMYSLSQSPSMEEMRPNRPRPEGGKHGFAESPKFQLSNFYTVAFSYEGETLEIKNEKPTIYEDYELESLAKEIVEKDVEAGTKDNLAYYKAEKDDCVLVVFVDNTVINEGAMTLFRYTLIIGAGVLVLFFFVAVFLARKIVQPLEESYQKQNKFISDAGHELKTPVSVVNANAELLAREIGENKWLANIQYENERMGVLVTQLLELARMEHVEIQMEKIDLGRLVKGESLPFESVAYEKGLTLDVNVENEIMMEGNSAQLKQLVSILLDNAIRHGEQGVVQLSLSKEHTKVSLSVINKGAEIPPEARKHIFERFYRVDEVRNGEDRHYGLGLAIAKSIVDLHKGTIEVLCYKGLVEFKVQIPL